MAFSLPAYLRRLALPASLADGGARAATRELLTTITSAHARAIPFENLDVVLRRPIDTSLNAVAAKLVDSARGGYCFEQNVLLAAALNALGFTAAPLLCRVRWGKAPDAETPFTHLALRVRASDAREYISDVGFAGSNSTHPVEIGAGEERLPEGAFRTAEGGAGARAGYTALQLRVRGEWRDLYVWRAGETASDADIALSNFWSYASPSARFTTSFFVARVVGDERHHILDGAYVVRRGLDGDAAVEEEAIADEARLRALLGGVFGIDAPAGSVEAWAAAYRRRA